MFDEREMAWSQKSVTVDGDDLPQPKTGRWWKSAPTLTWGQRSPTLEQALAGEIPIPDPGVRLLAEMLAPAVFGDEHETYVDALHRFLLSLPPPDVMPEVRIRANELRQHCGVLIVPSPPRVKAPEPPAVVLDIAPPDEPAPLVKPPGLR